MKNEETKACDRKDVCLAAVKDCTLEGATGREYACLEMLAEEKIVDAAWPVCLNASCKSNSKDVPNGCGFAFDLDAPPINEACPDFSATAISSVFVCGETSPPFTSMLPVSLTQDELAVHGSEMARLIGIWTKTKLDLKAYAKAANNLIKKTEAEYLEVAEMVNNGTEDREVDVYWQYDSKHALKRLYRCDTGEMVLEETMTAMDLQRDLGFQAEQSVKNVEAMQQGQAALDAGAGPPQGDEGQGDSGTASEEENASQGKSGASDEDWPDLPKEKTGDEWPEAPHGA